MQKQFLVYKSSAGSGKTYTLVKEYLKIVLVNPANVRHILAITFTNAAAAEMKSRIIEALGQIGRLEEDPTDPKGKNLLDNTIDELKETPEGAEATENLLIRNAQIALKQILHHYSDFAVSTIDSFVYRVIRTFAFDLRLPFQFDVALDAKTLLNQAVDLLIDRAGGDKQLTQLLITYITSQAEDEEDIRVEQKIAALAATLTEEDSMLHIEKLRSVPLQSFARTAGHLRASVKRFEEEIRKEARAAMQSIQDNGLSATDFYRGKQGMYSYFYKLTEEDIRERIEPNRYAEETVTEDKWASPKCSPERQGRIAGIVPELAARYYSIRAKAGSAAMHRYACEKALLRTIFPLALLSEVEKTTEEIKTEHGMLHISDFNKRIAGIITQQPVPFIYERLGEKYHHYMIDEFQDTSLLQWQNLLPLVVNGLSEGHMSLVVGDGKQAIYRFRNGDVEQFASLPLLTENIKPIAKAEWEVTLANNYRGETLETNWRSGKEIVGFTGRFFTFASSLLSERLRHIYHDVKQRSPEKKHEGYVDIAFIEDTADQTINEQTLEKISAIVGDCLRIGHLHSDITILCRSNNEASMVARDLLNRNIPVISPESLLLEQSDAVIFILSIIKLLANPFDTIAATEMIVFLHATKRIASPATLHECLRGIRPGSPTGSGSPGVRPRKYAETLVHRNGIDFSFDEFVHLNIYDTCERIVQVFFSGQRPPSPYVTFFMEAVYDCSGNQSLSHADFIRWWDENSGDYSIVVPEGAEAVQIMTIHKSKGLQFPVVIHPFAWQNPTKLTKKGLWTTGEKTGITDLPVQWLEMSKTSLSGTPFEVDLHLEQEKTFLDMLNAIYVAWTRPSEKLYIISKKEKNKYKPLSVNGLLYDFLQQEGLWQDTRDMYSWGVHAPPQKPGKPEKHSGVYAIRQLLSNPWSRALRMRSHQKERSTLLDAQDPLERGNLIHRALENILTVGDIAPVLRQMKDRGEIDQQKMTEWQEIISNLLNHPEVAPYFSPDAVIKTEAGIFDNDGSFYRPDRVVFSGSDCVVIDYKSGKRYQKHEHQLHTYAGILEKMGYRSVKKVLLYLDQGAVHIV